MSEQPSLRLVDLKGSGLERGLAHGEELRGPIEEALERWRQAVAHRRQMPSAQFAKQFLAATSYRSVISEISPDLDDEVRGIALGARQDLSEILAFNLMDEEWWFEPNAADLGCSVVATRVPLPGGEGQVTLLAQIERARQALADSNLDAIVLFNQESLFYLCGYDQIGYWVYQAAILTADSDEITMVVRVAGSEILDVGCPTSVRSGRGATTRTTTRYR